MYPYWILVITPYLLDYTFPILFLLSLDDWDRIYLLLNFSTNSFAT
jgi:hypothetical protein